MTIATFAALIVGSLLAIVLIWPPADLVRERVIAEVERQTGRRIAISGTRLDFGRGLAVTLSGVSLAGPPMMDKSPLLTASRIEVELALFPLIVREIHIERLTLVNPVLDLQIDPNGRRSWEFANVTSDHPGPIRLAQAPGRMNDAGRLPSDARDFMKNASPQPSARPAVAAVEQVSFGDVRVTGGRVDYRDARDGRALSLEQIEGRLSLPSAGGRLSISGTAVRDGDRFAIDGWVDSLRDALADRPVNTSAKLKGSAGEFSYEGRVGANLTVPSGEGRFTLTGPSPGALANLVGLRIAGLDAMRDIALEGNISATAGTYTIQNGQFALGASRATGTLAIDLAARKPRVSANLRFAVLDADELSQLRWGQSAHSEPPPTVGTATGRPGPGRFAPSKSIAPSTIDDLLRATPDPAGERDTKAPQVRGFRQRLANTWDVEAIDAALLKAIDLDGRFHVAELKSVALAARRLQLTVELKDAVLRSNLVEAEVAGGKLRGLVSIDVRQREMIVGANLAGEGVSLEPLLKAMDIEPIEGRGRWVVAVSSRGVSERDLVSGLAGRAELRVADGAVLGWDADAMIAGLAQGRIPSPDRQPGAKTPFKELSGTFQISQGVARSKDLKLDSATLVASGTGTVNIVDRNIDFMMRPRPSAGGIEVPVRIAGPWNQPGAVADVNAALRSPQAQEAVRQLKDGNVEGALRSVLGNDPKTEKKIDRAKELLRGFLKN